MSLSLIMLDNYWSGSLLNIISSKSHAESSRRTYSMFIMSSLHLCCNIYLAQIKLFIVRARLRPYLSGAGGA